MTDAERMSVLSELTAARGQAARLAVLCEEAGQADRARLLREQVAALKREHRRLTRALLRAWSDEASTLSAELVRCNQELTLRAEELSRDIARAQAFTEALGVLDAIVRAARKIV